MQDIQEGLWDHCKRVFNSDRLPFTIAYVLTIIGTLYCSLSWRNYLGTVIFSGLQITALLWYAATFVPGGTTGMKFLSGLVWSAVSNGFVPFCKGLASCCLGGSSSSAQTPNFSAGITSQAPDFNVVGQSGFNQVATALGQQNNTPIQAYVVSGDVTTAQALENNIIDTATF